MIYLLERTFNEQIRPALGQHGGDVDIIDLDNDILYVKFKGGCQGCASSKATLKGGIEKLIKIEFPEIKQVVDLTDHQAGENPYFK